MKKLLWIKDYKEFWKVFNQERMRERKKLRSLSFRKKLEMMQYGYRDRHKRKLRRSMLEKGRSA